MDWIFWFIADILLIAGILSVIIYCILTAHRRDPRQDESRRNLVQLKLNGEIPPGTHWEDGYLVKRK